MTAQRREAGHDDLVAVNEVRLVGRLSAEPEEKTMPSGDTLRSFRVVVDRGDGRGHSKQTVDALECVAWGGRVKRSIASWRPGDVVEVTGCLRRRFFRTAAGAASRVEVEVVSVRMHRRAAT